MTGAILRQAAPDVDIALVDYADADQGAALLSLLDLYARDPAGGGQPLDVERAPQIVPGLAATPGAFSLIAWQAGRPVGLANCFTGFSTFAARPLVNIHDLVVVPDCRGLGIGRALFAAIEAEARERGAVKVTLEVLRGNVRAQALYKSLGYGDYVLDPHMGEALFWQKVLT